MIPLKDTPKDFLNDLVTICEGFLEGIDKHSWRMSLRNCEGLRQGLHVGKIHSLPIKYFSLNLIFFSQMVELWSQQAVPRQKAFIRAVK